MSNEQGHFEHLSEEKRFLFSVQQMMNKLERMEKEKHEAIAIIGVGCRFPGGVNSLETYWHLLRDGIDPIQKLPAQHHNDDPLSCPSNIGWGGFLDHVDRFDASFFNISPREAMGLDPQQRLLLEVAWEALEHAAQTADESRSQQTGIFIGLSNSDYFTLQMDGTEPVIDAYSDTGNRVSFAAGRLSYFLGAQGPSMIIDTACSSSLVAVHLACQSLRNKECSMALAGGVNLILSPLSNEKTARLQALSPDGRCKTFDASANGFVRSEGCGVVVLKRLSDALHDKDTILALIRGSAINQDGRSALLTSPNGLAQQAVVLQALSQARVAPAQISYIETHGTGTSLGDPIEVEALKAIFGNRIVQEPDCVLGAHKTNIGHTEAAAGVAGLIKVIACLQNECIPANLHFTALNPHISLEDTPFIIPTELRPWLATDQPRYAGISAFGLSGTNAHVVVEEAPRSFSLPVREPDVTPQSYMLPLSARTPAALWALAESYHQWFSQSLISASASLIRDICYTASVRRKHHECRMAIVGQTLPEFTAQLADALQDRHAGDLSPLPGSSQHTLVFVCPGQGAQWIGMGRELLKDEPVFRAVIERCDALIQHYSGWSLLQELLAEPSQTRLEDYAEVAQPALFAYSIALAALLRSWGIVPDAVVGHSMGEIAAAYIAGALSLEDAVKISVHRGKLVQEVHNQGAMAAVDLSEEDMQPILEGYTGRLTIGVINGPRSVVLSGEEAALDEVLQSLSKRDISFQKLKVYYASHGPQMLQFESRMMALLHDLQPGATSIALFSSVTGERCSGAELQASYWIKNMQQCVQFYRVTARMIREGYDVFVELSPHPTLLAHIRDLLNEMQSQGITLATQRKGWEERKTLLQLVGDLYQYGYTPDWARLYAAAGSVVHLPAYPWQRERFWFTDLVTASPVKRKTSSERTVQDQVLPDAHVSSALHTDLHFWDGEISLERYPYLADHQVRGATIVPAATYLAMFMEAATTLFNAKPYVIEQIELKTMLVLQEQVPQRIQVAASLDQVGLVTVQVLSQPLTSPPGTEAANDNWTLHATGSLRLVSQEDTCPVMSDLIQKIDGCAEHISAEHFYANMQNSGLEYGPAFRGITQLWRQNNEVFASLQRPAELTGALFSSARIHPAFLDAALQALAATIVCRDRKEEYKGSASTSVPVSIGSLRQYGRFDTIAWSYACLRIEDGQRSIKNGLGKCVSGDIRLLDAQGKVLLDIQDLCLQSLEAERIAENEEQCILRDWLYAICWEERSLSSDGVSQQLEQETGYWCIFDIDEDHGLAYKEKLAAQGDACIVIRRAKHFAQIDACSYQVSPSDKNTFQEAFRRIASQMKAPCKGVLYLWALNEGDSQAISAEALLDMQERICGGVLYIVQSLLASDWQNLPRLWLVTRGAVAVSGSEVTLEAGQATLWGLARTLVYEHPQLRCSCIDVSSTSATEQAQAEVDALFAECMQSTKTRGQIETQVALRGSRRYVARLQQTRGQKLEEAQPQLQPAGQDAFCARLSQVGTLDRLQLVRMSRRTPGAGEVEIEVAAAGLNFLDVLTTLGALPTPPDASGRQEVHLGGECAGRIVALGEGVSGWQLGQEVIALAPDCFATHVIAPTTFLWPKPARLSMAQAASLPIVFTTAWLALHHLARLQAGERVLIHAAAGGVGLAAVQLAQQGGAEIFATAGSPRKRRYLHEQMGVRHVYDSRSLRFAEQIRAETAGEGVDVVLNSLAGDFLSSSLQLLADYGRFIEIGKRDYLQDRQVGLRPFLKNLSLSLLDLRAMSQQRPTQVHAACTAVLQQIEADRLQPLPIEVYPIAELPEAFRHMARGQHLGKIVLDLQPREQVPLLSQEEPRPVVREQGTYLLTGGAGGLGLQIARWLGQQGAGHLVLLGRRAQSPDVEALRQELASRGVGVTYWEADVAQPEVVEQVFAHLQQTLPPLRGIVHAAGVLEDATVQQLTEQQLRAVMEPKVAGAWNLHRASQGQELDWFVLFSSAASLLGSPGQGNYAAANAFLDALAQKRRREGQMALSINWGPWAQVGMAAQQSNRGERLEGAGMSSITPEQGVAAFAYLIAQTQVQVGVLPLNLRQWCQSYPMLAELAMFATLSEGKNSLGQVAHRDSTRNTLLTMSADQRRQTLETFLREQIAKLLRLPLALIHVQTPLKSLGFDSLMALELRNRLENSLELKLSTTLLWTYPTIAVLVPYLEQKLGYVDNVEKQPGQKSNESPHFAVAKEGAISGQIAREIAQLSKEEIRRQLMS